MKLLKATILILAGLSIILLTGCDWRDVAAYDITGTWQYTQYHEDENNESYVYSSGTVTFIGDRDRGTYSMVDNHGYTFKGTYDVRVSAIFLSGDLRWRGEFIDHSKIEGTWLSAGAVYEWEARR